MVIPLPCAVLKTVLSM